MAGDCDQRASLQIAVSSLSDVADNRNRPAEFERHVLDETGLAAAGGPLQQYGDLLFVRRHEQLDLILHGQVERLRVDYVLLDSVLAISLLGRHGALFSDACSLILH